MHNFYLYYIKRNIYIFVCLLAGYKEIHSIVIQFAFGNPTGGTVNLFYFV